MNSSPLPSARRAPLKPFVRRRLALLAVACLVTAPAAGQKRKLSLEDLTADPPLSGRAISEPRWVPGGARLSYLVKQGNDEDADAELWIEETANGQKRRIASSALLPLPLASASPGVEEKPRKISFGDYAWSPDGQSVLVAGADELWLVRAATGKLDRLTHTVEKEEHASFSPDGKRVAFVRRGDLWVTDLASGKELRLTRDGSERVLNGKLDWVYEEEFAGRKGRSYEWSPDGSAIAYLRLDQGRVQSSPIVDFLPVPAAVTMQRYPKAGSPNAIPSFRVVGVDGKPRGEIRFAADDLYVVPGFSWTPDSRAVSYRVMNRDQTRQEIRLLTLAEATSRTLFAEEDAYWINVFDPPRFLPKGRFLWASERDGFKHLYVGDVATGSLRALTSGAWMADKIAGVDPKKGVVYFTASAGDPRRRGIYRVGLDGKGFAKISTRPGTHDPKLSDDGRHLLDSFSSVGEPPSVWLLDAAGKELRAVDRPTGKLAEHDLGTVEEVTLRASDGASLYARLIKPSDFDPSRKYPVLVAVYGGPHAQVVVDSWTAVPLLHRLLAQKGILVWSLDNRGSWGRGHAWETPLFLEMGKVELADQLEGVRHLKSLPYVDPARIAINGWSYGGYMTLYAMTHSPETWKCGIAGAPVTHYKFYDTIYTERYMRTPEKNPRGYEASAPLSKAGALKAPLLLIHGTADDNVHLQNTLAFVDALTKARRPYDLQIQPGQKHGFRGKASRDSLNAAILAFLLKNLGSDLESAPLRGR